MTNFEQYVWGIYRGLKVAGASEDDDFLELYDASKDSTLDGDQLLSFIELYKGNNRDVCAELLDALIKDARNDTDGK